jgi:FkbM family methyltransferase
MFYGLKDGNGINLDNKLDILFNKKTEGFFIELGANNGLLQSNTAFFEKNRNWKGILIEPCVDNYNKCKINRPNSICYNCACVSNEYKNSTIEGDFLIENDSNESLMFSVNSIRRNNKKKLISISAITLEKILDNELINRDIDLLSLDVEGYEYEVLQGLNLNRYKPIYLLIEIYNNQYEKIINYLKQFNYNLLSNFSDYNKSNNPNWDGTHNDYLFILHK